MRRGVVAAVAAAALAAPGVARADKVVEAQNVWRFDASEYTIDQGEKLVFKNSDTLSPGNHNVTAKANGPDGKPIFASDTIDDGQQADVKGAQALKTGEYDFICTIHPFMEATLKVSDKGTPAGAAEPAPAPGAQPADTTRPAVRGALRTGRLRGALATNHIVASITSDELVRLRLLVQARAGRRGVTIARAQTTDGAPGRKVRVSIPLTPAGRRLLRRAHRLTVFLNVAATDASGNATAIRVRRTLTR